VTIKSFDESKKKGGNSEFKSPLLAGAWSLMHDGIRETISSEPIIPAIAAKAKTVAVSNAEFIRSDQGQVVGIFPEKEVYYGPSSGLEELRDLLWLAETRIFLQELSVFW